MAQEKKGGFKPLSLDDFDLSDISDKNTEMNSDFEKTKDKIKVKGEVIVKECKESIEKYGLKNLVRKAKNNFDSLSSEEINIMTEGLIKLGEALTFCREDLYKTDSIKEYAKKFSNVRNHLIHHYLYYKHRAELGNNELKKLIIEIPLIEDLEEKINSLTKYEFSKDIKKGINKFPFSFDHLIDCLEKELDGLEGIEKVTPEEIKNNINLSAKFSGHIRNILTILIDLTNENNTYLGNKESEKMKKINEMNKSYFLKENLSTFFLNLKNNRNSLCHLDAELVKPYANVEEMIGFGKDMIKLKSYIPELNECVGEKSKKKSSTPATVFQRLGYNKSNKNDLAKHAEKRKYEDEVDGEEKKQANKKPKNEKTEEDKLNSNDGKETDNLVGLPGDYGEFDDKEKDQKTNTENPTTTSATSSTSTNTTFGPGKNQ